MGVTEECSIRYASASGHTLETLCGPEYRYTGVNSTGIDCVLPDGGYIPFWILNAMTFFAWIIDSSSSWPYMLSQFHLSAPHLDTKVPSLAEGLLLVGTCGALDLIKDMPFDPRTVPL
ncbi:uncharacterized protein EKO05_0006724 [Ascochyta rabiei]|uniref:uncharacterized protein n=1 Tax=Didymella rabiei TaxID=5454 RepID=UPI002208B9BA|nr:uncharacterized protein EKO05_0006724 [Ascochyta rabiei]UPX16315.1 hypothetical protein EKO05_0006724 [Ascochyta rabiei]